jgi:predicted transcriptional regulator
MDNNLPPPAATAAPSPWNADQIFSILAEPARRHILLSLSRCKPSPASVIKDWVHLRLDATLKHLVEMRAAGLVVTSPDPTDGRRMLYSLAPSVPVVKTPEGAVMVDFGFCLLRH